MGTSHPKIFCHNYKMTLGTSIIVSLFHCVQCLPIANEKDKFLTAAKNVNDGVKKNKRHLINEDAFEVKVSAFHCNFRPADYCIHNTRVEQG